MIFRRASGRSAHFSLLSTALTLAAKTYGAPYFVGARAHNTRTRERKERKGTCLPVPITRALSVRPLTYMSMLKR